MTASIGDLPKLDGDLRAIFDDFGGGDAGPAIAAWRLAGALLGRLERELMADVYRWTGHFPERTRALVRYLADRADQMHLRYPPDREVAVIVALVTLVTTLAMNHVQHASYVPETKSR
jgi:hypothetical protein